MWQNAQCLSLDDITSLIKLIEQSFNKKFDYLLNDLSIDIKKNKKLSSEYYELVKRNNKELRLVKILSIFRWIFIIFLIFPFFILTKLLKKRQAILDANQKLQFSLQTQLQTLIRPIFKSISNSFIYKSIIEECWRDVKINLFPPSIDSMVWNDMINELLPKNAYVKQWISGRLFNHPFALYDYCQQTIYMHTYVGVGVATYTYTDSSGKTQFSTETVTASITEPAPKWDIMQRFAYLISKPANLCFSNNVSNKQFKKNSDKELINLENDKFNKLFKATRNDEKEYRIVFTPLAQEKYVELLQKFNFVIEKEKNITFTYLNSKCLLSINSIEKNYDLEVYKKNIFHWITQFVNHLCKSSLPISCIPVYRDIDYIYPTIIKNNLSFQQVMHNITHLFDIYNKWKNYETNVIFSINNSYHILDKKFSVIAINVNYFLPEHKTSIVPTFAPRSGKMVNVIVKWIKYHPKSQVVYLVQSNNNIPFEDNLKLNDDYIIYYGKIIKIFDNIPSNNDFISLSMIVKDNKI